MSNPSKATGTVLPVKDIVFTRRDVILYALGIGATEPRFTYEGDDAFSAIPTFPVVLSFKGDSFDIVNFAENAIDFPGIEFDPSQILHGEQSVRILKHPLPVEGRFTNHSRIKAVYDKGSGALIILESVMKDAAGVDLVAFESGIFIRGIGGWGGERGPSGKENESPTRAPDASITESTTSTQALLYRLSGDYNPLHADPGMASMVGFKAPILHGLCFFGFAGRAVLRQFCDNDVTKFGAITCRFSKSVFPGEQLTTDMWREGNRVLFRTRVGDRVVISNGCVELAGAAAPAIAAAPAPSSSTLKSAAIFDAMKSALAKQPEIVKKVNAVYQFNLTAADGSTVVYHVDLKNGGGSVLLGVGPAKPDCEITMSDENYFLMSTGKLNAQQAFMKGQLKLKGNMALAQKLSHLQALSSKL